MKRTSPQPAMKHSVTSSEARARASWPLPEPTLAYFPDARSGTSGRDQDVRSFSSRSELFGVPTRNWVSMCGSRHG